MKRVSTPTAVDKGRVAWRGECELYRAAETAAQEAAYAKRRTLRRMGVTGELRRLSDRAKGDRGRSVTQQLFDDARDEAMNGLPLDEALAKARQVVDLTVRLGYQQAERDQGGRSA